MAPPGYSCYNEPMRLSDLKKKASRPAEPPPPRVDEPPVRPAPARSASPPPAAQPAKPAGPAARKAVKPAPVNLDRQRLQAKALYGRLIGELQPILGAVGPQPAGALDSLAATVGEISESALAGNQALLLQANCDSPDDPVCSHSANVAIFCVYVAAGLRWPAADLARLGLAALLHDLGRPMSFRLGLEPGLSADEVWRIRAAMEEAPKRLDLFPDADEEAKGALASIILQLHSLPQAAGATGPDRVALSAQLVSLCDLYEALTHGWEGHPHVPAHLAFKTLLSFKNRFESSIVKRLIENISPFPLGTLIQLADGRVACVVGINPGMITRPLVEVWLQSDGSAQDPTVVVDLSQELLTGIAGAADVKKPVVAAAAERVRAHWLWKPA